MTTGMSPPPIEATRCQPKASATTVMIASGTIECDARNHAISPADTTTASRLSQCRAGSTRGADFIRSLSFRNATIDPVNVTAPMNTPRKTSTRWMVSEVAPAPGSRKLL